MKRYHAGWGGEKQKRHAVGSATVVCGAVVVVVWRCPFDDAKAPRTNYFVPFSLFSFCSVLYIFFTADKK